MALYWLTLQFYVCMYISFVCWYVAHPGECYYNTLLHCDDVSCAYSTFWHHPHPLGYLCAKFHFFDSPLAELAHGEKSHTQSLIPLIWCPGNRRFRFRIYNIFNSYYSTENIRSVNHVFSNDFTFQYVITYAEFYYNALDCIFHMLYVISFLHAVYASVLCNKSYILHITLQSWLTFSSIGVLVRSLSCRVIWSIVH